MPAFDPNKIAADLQWLQDHPWFEEKPASITEFLDTDYLNIRKNIRPGVERALVGIFGEDTNGDRIAIVRLAMFTGAIGIGKTTLASIVIPYMVHWVLCLKDPQDFYNLIPGSRIAFMQMSTSKPQATETVFGDIKARIQHSPWFTNNYPYDPKYEKQLRFPKNVWVLPGSSDETSFEGYNILGGILDEADSHKQTQNKDYAEQGYDTIYTRIDSRFDDRGFLLVIGQMKKSNGFAAKKYKEFCEDPDAYTIRMTLWESFGWEKYLAPDGSHDSFWYDSKRKQILDKEAARLLGYPEHIVEVPKLYEKNFKNSPEKALRDLAGIPPHAGSAFISLTHKIDEAMERWVERWGDDPPVDADPVRPRLASWLHDPTPLRRELHLDIGYSANGDAAGIAMGHVHHLVKDEEEGGEEKPYIVIDCLIRVKAPPGNEVFLSDLRNYIYELKRRGFRIRDVSMDGFQSTDTRQQLRKKRMNVHYLSIDKSKLPYEDLRDALYEDRIEIPPYMTYLNVGDANAVNIVLKELRELEDTGKKIDHPVNGSKDVADCVAGVVTMLMGDRTYHRRVSSNQNPTEDTEQETLQPQKPVSGGQGIDALSALLHRGYDGLSAPVPPSTDYGQYLFPRD